MGPLGLIGYGIEDGDLVKGIGGGFPTLPVHAYIPMIHDGVRVEAIEEPAVAYLNQMRAKRVADAARKRYKRRLMKPQPPEFITPRYRQNTKKFIVVGIRIK